MAILIMLAAADAVSAHRRDEYLQAARIAVEPEEVRVDLELTPGIEVADTVLADIDHDGDAALSGNEMDEYAARLATGLTLEVDGQALRVDMEEVTFPDITALRRGEGTIQLRVRARLPALSTGRHQLRFRSEERHDISVYLANALVPESPRVAIAGQRRTPSQSELTIDFTLGSHGRPLPLWLLTTLSGVAGLAVLLIRPARSRPRSPRRCDDRPALSAAIPPH